MYKKVSEEIVLSHCQNIFLPLNKQPFLKLMETYFGTRLFITTRDFYIK